MIKTDEQILKDPGQEFFSSHRTLRRFCEHRMALWGAGILLVEIFAVALVPYFINFMPNVSDPQAIMAKPGGLHPLGTDSLGRDMLSRMLAGGRVSLLIGISSTCIGLLIGVPMGLIAGYFRGMLEHVIMRAVDIFMSFPSMVLILVLVSAIGPSTAAVASVIGVLGWMRFARITHSSVISEREKQYVKAARSIGAGNGLILFQYILPNVLGPVLIAMTFNTAAAIITESSLSFVGLGVQPPQASWGNLLYSAQSIAVFARNPWIWLPPGAALVLTTLSINFVGDGLRDALDPKTLV
jgi:peptide/nickel transport system permease protein